jgi:hypothetical protein
VLDVEVLESINADRRPDLRDAILDGTLQVVSCGRCDARFRVAPALNYMDSERGQWISAQPLSQIGAWPENEAAAVAVFATAYGEDAPPPAREIGAGLVVRLTFGWAAFREKLVAREAGLDDRILEELKMSITQGGGPLRRYVELRLDAVEGTDLVMVWLDARTETPLETLVVPRKLYDTIAADPAAWATVTANLGNGPFLDMQRLYLAA